MKPIEPFPYAGTTPVVFARDQPEYQPLPALLFDDGKILVEFELDDTDRQKIARGENLRLWIWKPRAAPLQPILVDITDEHQG